MSIDTILNKFERVRKSGRNKWRVPCPVHGGKDFNMIISERSDGSVGAYCFVCGGSAVDVANHYGLDLKEIFAPDSDYKAPVITRQMLEDEQMDRMILAMAENTPPQTLADKRRVKMAQARLEGIEEKRRHIEDTNKATQNVDNEAMPF